MYSKSCKLELKHTKDQMEYNKQASTVFLVSKDIYLYIHTDICVCVCLSVRERERESHCKFERATDKENKNTCKSN